ncbi:MAG: ClC family H(+)/Cl(-) exchange transporter [Bacillota bacterium]
MLKTERSYWITIAASIVVGGFVGIAISLYRYFVENIATVMDTFYRAAAHSWWLLIILFALLSGAGLLSCWLVQREPYISGSGVPQTQMEINNPAERNWLKLIGYKIFGGVICLGVGLSLGREGPSVQIGSLVGASVRKFFKTEIDFKLLFGCGAGAGLAAALNAPLAGAMFAIEELYKKLSPLTLVCVLLASITSTMVTEKLFGIAPLIKITEFPVPKLTEYGIIILIGVLAGVLGAFFSKSYFWLYDRCQNIDRKIKFVGIFIITGIFGLTIPQLLGVREGCFATAAIENSVLLWVVALFLLKWLFTMASMLSNAPGGIFVPLLGLGMLLGLIAAKSCAAVGITTDANMIMVLVMGGYFTAIIRAPLTAVALTAELTNSFVCFLPLAVVCVAAMLTADFLGTRPIYEELVERNLAKANHK